MKPGYTSIVDSPGAGFWPDPRKEAFKRLQRTHRSQVFTNRAKNHKIYLYEEGSFYFPQVNALALSNKYDCLSYDNNNNFSNEDDDVNNSDYDRYQLMNDGDLNLFLNDVPDYAYDFEFAENIYKKNKK